MRIVSVSSSRADVGILSPVWRALSAVDADLHVIATGMHCAPGAPRVDLGGADATLHEVGRDLGGHGNALAAGAMGDIVQACGRLYEEIKPDVVLVIGDRLDMLPAAVASLPFNHPLAHLHGGEVTEGAIDDRVRHAITQLAHLHLVSCASAAERVRRMRGARADIVITGAPGLDTLRAATAMSRTEFLVETGLADIPGASEAFILATVHPETNSADPQAPMTVILQALDEVQLPVLFTAPNSDPGGADMRARLDAWVSTRSFVRFVDTLGSRLYPNALRHASVMVGNSSSGIVEAGLFGLPVVDVGDRQKGRVRGGNVLAAPNDATKVAEVLQRAISGGRFPPGSPYGNGNAAPRVAEAIFGTNPSNRSFTTRGATRGK